MIADAAGVILNLRRENPRRFRQRMATTRVLLRAGSLEVEDAVAQVRAGLAHAQHGHDRRKRWLV